MQTLITVLDNIYKHYNEKASLSYIGNLIIDSIMISIYEEIGVDVLDIMKIHENRHYEVINSKAYRTLKEYSKNIAFDNPDVLQTVYEYIIKNEKEKKEKHSIYYTPNWLATYIVKDVFDKITISEYSIPNLKVLEPSCGCGGFLTCVFDVIFEYYTKHTQMSHCKIVSNILQKNLYGIDIDKSALKICKFILLLKAFKKTHVFKDYDINLYNKDFLVDDLVKLKNIDIIIGNPPYLENRKINKYYDKAFLKEKYTTARGRFDIYSLFIEKSLCLLKRNGYLSFVLPGNLLTNNNFHEIRKLILNKTCIMGIIYLGEGIFDDVGMNMIAISFLNNSDNFDNKIKCKNISNELDKMNNIHIENYKYICQKYYHNTLMNVFDIASSDTTFKLRERLFKENYTKLNDICEIIAGIATGNIRHKLINKNANNKYSVKVLEGKNIFPFYHKWGGKYFIDDKSLIDKSKGEYATFMRNDFIGVEKILIRQTADRFICSYDNEGYYILNTLYSLKIRPEYKNEISYKYVLALLNSKLYSFLYRTLVREEGKLFPQLKIFHIQHSPVIIPSQKIQDKIIKMTDVIIENYKKLSNNDKLPTNFENELKLEINRNLNIIDKMIYKIFSLSDEEILEIEKSMDN